MNIIIIIQYKEMSDRRQKLRLELESINHGDHNTSHLRYSINKLRRDIKYEIEAEAAPKRQYRSPCQRNYKH